MGQVVVLVAVFLAGLLGATALSIDGGTGMYRLRQMQNAVDFAALGVADKLAPTCGQATGMPNGTVSNIIADELAADRPTATWTAQYLDAAGVPMLVGGKPIEVTTTPRGTRVAGACGVAIQGSTSWRPTLAYILGFKQLSSPARAAALATPAAAALPPAPPAGKFGAINALDTSHTHSIFAGSNGKFLATGDVFDNWVAPPSWSLPSYCYDGNNKFVQIVPAGSSCPAGTRGVVYNDAADAKDASTITITGTLSSPGTPLDRCYGQITVLPPSGTANCSGQGGITYGGVITNAAGYNADPLAASLGAAPTTSGCNGAQTTYNSQGPSTGPFFPGVYAFPLDVSGAAGAGAAAPTFMDCGGGNPGVYIFQRGVHIHPGAGQTVYGSNVIFVSQTPIPDSSLPGNNGAGDASGAPAGATYSVRGGVMPSSGPNHTGLNMSVDIGGNGTVTLTSPSSGPYAGTVLWQTPGVNANFGFDNGSTESTVITLNGSVDNSTISNGITAFSSGYEPTCGGCDTGYIIPYASGGTLMMGQTLQFNLPRPQGAVTINGSAVVDIFMTTGYLDATVVAGSAAGGGGSGGGGGGGSGTTPSAPPKLVY